MKTAGRLTVLVLILGLITIVLAMSSCARHSDEFVSSQDLHTDESTIDLPHDTDEEAETSVTQAETSQATVQAETQPETLTETPSSTALETSNETSQEAVQEMTSETVSETTKGVPKSSAITKETSQQDPGDHEAETAADLSMEASSEEMTVCSSGSNELPPIIDED